MDNNQSFKKSAFEKVLKKIFPKNSQSPSLIGFEEKPVVATGDSYTSNIKRVFIEFKFPGKDPEKVPVIVKTQVRGSLVEDWTIELDFFKTEIQMFLEVFPKLERILKHSISSECYLATEKPDFALILQDLQPLGYEMMDRTIGFDMEHTKGVLKTLAELHSASVVLANENNLGRFTKGLFSDSKVSTKWMRDGFKSLSKTCISMEECRKYGEKLEALKDEAIHRGLKAAKRIPGEFSVLNHGDMWANNMLFLHDKKGNLLNTKLIDFQLVKFTSPALDLHYFHATSWQRNVRNDLGMVLDYYYSELIRNFVQLKYPLKNVPSRKELQRDFEERAFYGIVALATVTPLVKAPPRKDANFENLSKTDEDPNSFREFIYSHEGYKDCVRQLMPYFDSLGILD